MKIGTFAKKHNVSMHTIRHYLDLELLLAEKIGTQYSFTTEDSRDMEEIKELKRLKFSLEEIQKIFVYKRLDGKKTIGFNEHFRLFLENKKEELRRHMEDIEETLSYVDKKIYQLKASESKRRQLNFPINMVVYLRCAHCGSELNLYEANIENNMVTSGNFICSCGYKITIQNGIIVDKSAVKNKDTPSKNEYYEKTSPKFINYIFKSIETLMKAIEKEDVEKKVILELSHCSGFFLMKYMPYLPKESTYILVDYDFNRLYDLKRNLEANSDHKNFIFLCCDFDKLPLMNNLISLVIDCFTNKEHAKKDGRVFKDNILPLIKSGGHTACIYTYFSPSDLYSNEVQGKDKDIYNKEHLLTMLESGGVHRVYLKERETAEQGNGYNSAGKGVNYQHLIYLGSK
ncbi:MerR family transcriptional regulator [Clostridium polynesiense]|uniref:MerR family transcriptional regulator n=1 Tax=Clostridium polynesiense TaxID=1325933 RepID=UPI00058B8AF4|nr:MerR family transcriptional regulator [Clostridium polynesiense]